MASIGEAIALGNLARAPQDKPISNAILRQQNLDLSRQAQQAKRAQEEAQRKQNIMGMVKSKGGFLPMYAEAAQDIYASGINQMMGEKNPVMAQSIGNQTNFALENLQAENEQLKQNLNTARGKGLVTQDVFEMFNLPRAQAVKKYQEYVSKNPEIQEIVTLGPNGFLQFNPIENVDIPSKYDEAVTGLKGTAVPKKDAKGNWEKRKMLDNSFQFVSTADPAALKSRSVELASDLNFGANIRLKRPKEYKDAYNQLALQAQKGGIEVTQDDLKLAATAKVINDDLSKQAVYLEEKSNPAPSNFNFGFNASGGYNTPNKWTLAPADTQHGKDLQPLVDEYNKKHPNENKTIETLFGKDFVAGPQNFDEVVLENQDVSENKTFQYPDGKGGLVNLVPVSIRRAKSGGDWVLVGKRENPEYKPNRPQSESNSKFIDIELPYNNAVRQKTDAILSTNTKDVLNEMFPNKPSGKSNSKQGNAQPPNKAPR